MDRERRVSDRDRFDDDFDRMSRSRQPRSSARPPPPPVDDAYYGIASRQPPAVAASGVGP